MADTSDNPASTAAWALAHIRGPADSVLLEALHDSNPRVRRLAAYALGEAGPGIEGASAALSGARQAEPDSGVRAMIIWAQGQMGGRKLRDLNMVRALQSPDSTGRQEAIRRLAATAAVNPDVLEILIHTLGSSDSLLRDGAARALGRIGEPARYALQGALRDPNPSIRAGAANVLARGQTSGF
jgi:HEAT repeat protein